ncbi:MAG: hypothetical protein FWD61_07135 [Phycisphaerales bacterium]|nr:hypothetical protein [Phycisphaerales bacterium]
MIRTCINSFPVTLSPCHLVTLSLFLLAGCSSTDPLERAYEPARPDFTATTLPNPGPDFPSPPTSHIHIIHPDPSAREPATILVEPLITGTWTFTAPPTTTTLERKTADFHQFFIYEGQGGCPAPSDTPFLVITVPATTTTITRSLTAADPGTYQVSSMRRYVLNGNIAQESTGHTNTGAAFNELILTKPGTGGRDQCRAIAIATTDYQRSLALEILSSLTWTPNPTHSTP